VEKSRRHYSPQQKVVILREHLTEQVPISELCEKHHRHPTLFYQWQKTFFENGAAAFEQERAYSELLSFSNRRLFTLENSGDCCCEGLITRVRGRVGESSWRFLKARRTSAGIA